MLAVCSKRLYSNRFAYEELTIPLSYLGAGNGDISVVIVDPQGKKDTVELILENKGDSVFRCTYHPMLEGRHTIHVLFAGQEIPQSPFTVNISEGKPPLCLRSRLLSDKSGLLLCC